MAPFELDIPPHVADVLRHLPPDIKRPVKAALRAIGADASIGAPLERELKGLWRFRVSPTSTVRRAIWARSVGKSFVFNAAFQNCLNSD